MKCILIIGFIITQLAGMTQNRSVDLLQSKWNAKWIAFDDNGQDYGVYHFRKKISLDEKPDSFIIHVSADNRYKLYVNETLVSLGPARSDLYHWNYETIDIAPYLKAGDNILASVVWNFGTGRSLSLISARTAFIIQGNTSAEEIINTDISWKCIKNESYSPVPPKQVHGYYALGPNERIDFHQYPIAWESSTFDDSKWPNSKVIVNGLPKGAFDWFNFWMLVPRSIPQMELIPQRFQSVREAKGITPPKDFLQTRSVLAVPANAVVDLLFDQGQLTNAYAVMEFSEGEQAALSLQYGEALYRNEEDKKDWRSQHSKGNRNEVAGKILIGGKDEFISNGKNNQRFTSLDWRTFRYVKLHIETKAEPLQINDISSVFTGYPFQWQAKFDAKDNELSKIFNVGWHTARLCAIETYVDCPYYEQLQYFGDTRIQCMISLYNTSDDRLVRNAITQGDQSRLPEGITLSRYPSSLDQQIPPFALWWIGTVYDYHIYRDDPGFVRSFLPGIREVLTFFSKYQLPDGRLKNPPYWEFSDWASGGGWKDGVAPKGDDGCSAVLDFQLLLAYQTAAELENDLGLKELAKEYLQRAEVLKQSLEEKYWDSDKRIFFDTQEKKYSSQHTNTLAILTGTVKDKVAADLANRVLLDTTLTEATIYFKYYVNQAITKAGLGNSYLDQLGIWKENLKMGLTTWAEMSDVNNSRSDCHAWGASPNIEFFRIVLGIDSDAPGFSKVKITPHLGNLKQASGSMPHPKGEINVNYTSDKKGKWRAVISIPPGTSGIFVWKDKSFELKAGMNTLAL
jgi:alpha-L-rhamnosidase